MPVPLLPAAVEPQSPSPAEVRRARVLERLLEAGGLDPDSVRELALEHGVSEAQIRRDRYAVRAEYAKHLDRDRQGERADLVARVREAASADPSRWQLLKLEGELLPPAPPASDGSEDFFTSEEEALRYLATFPPDLLRRALELQAEGA